jgi:hypothetical protein
VTDRPILAVARGTRYDVGGNRKGSTAGATWSLLLPDLPLGRVAAFGAPDSASRARIEELADETFEGLPPDGQVDVIWLAPGSSGPVPDRASLRSRLAAGGVLVDERSNHADEDAGGGVARFRVLRRDGDTLVALAVAHPAVQGWLRRRGLAGPEARGPMVHVRARVSALRRRGRPVSPATWGTLDLVGQADLEQPPRYLRDLAAAGGVDIARHAWGMSATGPYRTQKVLVPLIAPGALEPELIVKLTRHPSVNPRLQVELDGLRLLATVGPRFAERVPAVRFAGLHAGLLVVGESVLHGDRFRAPDAHRNPLATDAVAWLTELGVRTATPVGAAEAAAALDDLVDAYVAVDGPGRDLGGELRASVERIRSHPDPFPVVVQHGDPGRSNLVAMPGDRTGFLDWENLENRGMPLWDLFYLLRSLAVGSQRRRPLEGRLGHVQRMFLDTSELTPFVVDAVRRYCAQVGVADDLIEPLYHLGWMYQALKEVTRLAPGRLGEGHFYGLLRRGFDRRGNGTLDRLFKGDHL